MIILGIDYGEKKTGLAIADHGIVEPLLVLKTEELLNWISSQVKEANFEKIVIGLPGGDLDKKIKVLGADLEKTIGLPVEFYDETLTTLDAQKILSKIKRSKIYRKTKEDAVAAAVILESYCWANKNGGFKS